MIGVPLVLMLVAQTLIVLAALVPPSLLGDDWPWFVAGFSVTTISLARSLARVAAVRGQSKWWGLMSPLGLIGFVTVCCLPDLTDRPVRGFAIAPSQDS